MLMDHPSPHMLALLDALANRDELAAQVIYFRPGAPERNWEDPPSDLPHKFAATSKRSSSWLTVFPLLQQMRSTRTDIWVVNSCYTAPQTWAAIRYLNRTSQPWVYMNEPVRTRGLFDTLKRTVLRSLLHKANGIVGMGRDAQAQYCSIIGRKLPSVSVPYFLDLKEFFAISPREIKADTEPVHFFIAAQMIRRKGFDVLQAACSQLPEANWKLTIAGDGPLRSGLERSFGAKFGRDTVQFLGHVSYKERAALFAEQHVFVFPSRWDGWGMAPVEAMAAGLPVISTNQVMSMREFIKEGENGFLVNSENSAALADRMRRFIHDPLKIYAMGREARSTLLDFKPEAGAEILTSFLAELANNAKAGSYRASSSTVLRQNPAITWKYLTDPSGTRQWFQQQCRAQAKQAVIDFSLAVRPRFVAKGNRILVYHLVLGEDKAQFSEHIKFLKDHYQLVTAAEVAHKRLQPGSGPMLAITFDDGFKILMFDALEIMEKHGVKATFFVPTGFTHSAAIRDHVEQFSMRAHYYKHPLDPMSPDDLKQLNHLGHEIGSHGVSHIGVDALSKNAAICELDESRRQLSEWLRAPIKGFAYPYGGRTSTIGNPLEWVASAGYEYAVTLQRGQVNRESNPMSLPREHAEGNWPLRNLMYFLGK